jgi:hypothetical protein
MSHSPDLTPPEQGKPAVNAGRRRFARAGAAAPVVLGTLASQPVLATGGTKPPYHCTISGQMSGNLSRAPDSTDCKTVGRSPGYWKNHDWPAGVKGSLPVSGCSMASGTSLGTLFSAKFKHAFSRKSVSGVCVIYDLRQTGFNTTASSSASMLEVLNYGGGLNELSLKALGRAAVASWLNAHQFGLAYPLTAAKVVEMFNAVAATGGKYRVNASTQWDANQVQTYFQSLYGNL